MKEQAKERCPQIDYTGQVMQVLLLLLINSVSCYVNVLHGMSRHQANVQGSWDYSLNKDVAQTAWNCVSVPGRVMMDDNRMRMKSLLLCFGSADTSLSRLKEWEAGCCFFIANPKPLEILRPSDILSFFVIITMDSGFGCPLFSRLTALLFQLSYFHKG